MTVEELIQHLRSVNRNLTVKISLGAFITDDLYTIRESTMGDTGEGTLVLYGQHTPAGLAKPQLEALKTLYLRD